jgi:hypothetical protein
MIKKIFILLGLALLPITAWADGELTPEPLKQAVQEYKSFWKADEIDPDNHVVWKLYVKADVMLHSGVNRTPEIIRASLRPYGKHPHYVLISINDLWNSLHSTPKKGDVITVSGHVTHCAHTHLTSGFKDYVLSTLTLYPQNAAYLPEHFDPSATPTATRPSETPSDSATPDPDGDKDE